MNSDDTLYGVVRHGTLALSGNNPSIRVDGGTIIVADGPQSYRPPIADPRRR